MVNGRKCCKSKEANYEDGDCESITTGEVTKKKALALVATEQPQLFEPFFVFLKEPYSNN
ncbi:hypothetical protein NUACC21_77510 [Scytonema sp. NUACC21]